MLEQDENVGKVEKTASTSPNQPVINVFMGENQKGRLGKKGGASAETLPHELSASVSVVEEHAEEGLQQPYMASAYSDPSTFDEATVRCQPYFRCFAC